MIVVGYILLTIGVLFGIVGDVMLLAVAYRRNLWWFFGCLFIPVVWLLFFLLNVKATAKPFALSLGGLVLAGIGSLMAGIVWPACCL